VVVVKGGDLRDENLDDHDKLEMNQRNDMKSINSFNGIYVLSPKMSSRSDHRAFVALSLNFKKTTTSSAGRVESYGMKIPLLLFFV